MAASNDSCRGSIIVGRLVCHGALASLAAALVCIGNILYWRQIEECALESLYGGDDRVYRQGTWF